MDINTRGKTRVMPDLAANHPLIKIFDLSCDCECIEPILSKFHRYNMDDMISERLVVALYGSHSLPAQSRHCIVRVKWL